MEYVNGRGEVVALAGLGPQWQQPTPAEKRAEVMASCVGWDVSWDSLGLRLVGRHPQHKTNGIQVVGKTPTELIARIKAL